MSIKDFLLSIVKRPSFNLLAFQAFTFTILAIAGVIGAFQFVPFLGIKDTSAYYFIVYFYIAAGVIIYTSVIFLIGGILKKIHIILFNKSLTIINFILFYIIYTVLIRIYYIPSSTPTACAGYGWMLAFGIVFIINGIVYFAVPLYGIILVIEQIRKIRIEPPQYCRTPVRFWAVVIPAIIYIGIIIYIFFELFT